MKIPAYLLSRSGAVNDLAPIDSRQIPLKNLKEAEGILAARPASFDVWYGTQDGQEFRFMVALDTPGVFYSSLWFGKLPVALYLCFSGSFPEEERQVLDASWSTLTEGLEGSGIAVAPQRPTLLPGKKAVVIVLPTLLGHEDLAGEAAVAFGAMVIKWLEKSVQPSVN